MNTLNKKNIGLVLMMTLGAVFSVNASALPAGSVEVAASDFIVEQGKQMVTELNKQLQQSIAQEIKAISLNFTFNETAVAIDDTKTIKVVKAKLENKPQTKSEAE